MSPRDQKRLLELQRKGKIELEGNRICPFKLRSGVPTLCTKSGGVCSLRLYQRGDDGRVQPAEGERDGLRAVCPNRFHEDLTAFSWVSTSGIDAAAYLSVGEVGFLESDRSLDGAGGDDVGRLDMILVDSNSIDEPSLNWIAAEIQAVYFSGPEMATEFRAIREDVENGGTGLIWPTEVRRPDYRSSGPKRLMPQLQIKVPTLRRWGKKMAVIIDEAFYQSLGAMSTVEHLSNSDIAWFVAKFRWNESTRAYQLTRGNIIMTTLEEAVVGLTAGRPVSQPEFEKRIRTNLAKQRPSLNDSAGTFVEPIQIASD
ncbi:MAG TPA: NotI family restriction endonuclease [Casimicrobium sp.]|nr:NotI family restriction endonuclease [Casimicrobium sp.]